MLTREIAKLIHASAEHGHAGDVAIIFMGKNDVHWSRGEKIAATTIIMMELRRPNATVIVEKSTRVYGDEYTIAFVGGADDTAMRLTTISGEVDLGDLLQALKFEAQRFSIIQVDGELLTFE